MKQNSNKNKSKRNNNNKSSNNNNCQQTGIPRTFNNIPAPKSFHTGLIFNPNKAEINSLQNNENNKLLTVKETKNYMKNNHLYYDNQDWINKHNLKQKSNLVIGKNMNDLEINRNKSARNMRSYIGAKEEIKDSKENNSNKMKAPTTNVTVNAKAALEKKYIEEMIKQSNDITSNGSSNINKNNNNIMNNNSRPNTSSNPNPNVNNNPSNNIINPSFIPNNKTNNKDKDLICKRYFETKNELKLHKDFGYIPQ